MTATNAADLEGFASRYALEVIDDVGNGVLVDLMSGRFFQMNASAVTVCQVLTVSRNVADATQHLAKALGVPTSAAEDILSTMTTELRNAVAQAAAPDVFVYRSLGEGMYALDEGGQRVFTVDSQRRTFQSFGVHRDEAVHAAYVRAVVPKLLALLERSILHASACKVGSRMLGICGKSGAGKTTTAKALEEAGAKLISEDLLILADRSPRPSVYVDGERDARRWCREAARQFRAQPGIALSYAALAEIGGGTIVPLDGLWFVDATRRTGRELVLRHLSKAEAATLLMGNGFLATEDPAGWRRFLGRMADLVRHLPVHEATPPATLDLLKAAALDYTVNSTS